MAVVLLDASVVSSILSINQADPSQPFTVERYQKLIENRPSPKRRDARDLVGARLPREDPWGETIVASEEVTVMVRLHRWAWEQRSGHGPPI